MTKKEKTKTQTGCLWTSNDDTLIQSWYDIYIIYTLYTSYCNRNYVAIDVTNPWILRDSSFVEILLIQEITIHY